MILETISGGMPEELALEVMLATLAEIAYDGRVVVVRFSEFR
jgi:hypothetical protein